MLSSKSTLKVTLPQITLLVSLVYAIPDGLDSERLFW